MQTRFGDILRDWRKQRRMSQLDLGLHANVSARHISFIESGRAKPSREMVGNLARSLQMTKTQTNLATIAAGFAPIYRDHDGASDLRPIHHAIDCLLKNHMPFPGIVLDGQWNIVNANSAAQSLLVKTEFSGQQNLVAALLASNPENGSIQNWHETVALVLSRLESEISQRGQDETLMTQYRQLNTHFQSHNGAAAKVDYSQAVIPTRFKIDGRTISVFSTMAHFGTVFDLTLADMQVELMFPADSESESYFRNQ